MKTCPGCGTENRDTAQFCRRCSRRLPSERRCPNCGRANPPDAQFCNQCSYSFAGKSVPTPGQTGLLAPQSLLDGRYRILRRVGAGGMGAVYEAEDLRLTGKRWAIKEMSDAAITDPKERAEVLEAFHREARFLSMLDHPNLPKVIDTFETDGKQYLVMEFVDGPTLESLVVEADRPLDPDWALRLGIDVCSVLDYLHRQTPSIIFRDLKPGNIMIDSDHTVKLIDFGIARLFTPGKSRDTTNLGTKGYAAPEQYGKGQTDARSDIYSLGATLHFLLTGRDPADEPLKFPPVRTLNAAASPALEGVIARAVALAPDERWQTAREMRQALSRAAAVPQGTAKLAAGGVVTGSSHAGAPASLPRPRAAAPGNPRVRPRPAADPLRPAVGLPRLAPPTSPPTQSSRWRESTWFYFLVIIALSALIIFLQEFGILRPLFPLFWFTLSMLAGILARQIGAIGFTWLSVPLYNSVVGQANVLSWTVMLALIVPIELFFLLTRYRFYTPVTLLLAGGLGVLGLWLAADMPANDLVLSGIAIALGSLIAYVLGQWLEPYLT